MSCQSFGGNMQLIKIWGDDHGPWMQALHCVFGVGALLGPLLATPFLSVTNQVRVFFLIDVLKLFRYKCIVFTKHFEEAVFVYISFFHIIGFHG